MRSVKIKKAGIRFEKGQVSRGSNFGSLQREIHMSFLRLRRSSPQSHLTGNVWLEKRRQPKAAASNWKSHNNQKQRRLNLFVRDQNRSNFPPECKQHNNIYSIKFRLSAGFATYKHPLTISGRDLPPNSGTFQVEADIYPSFMVFVSLAQIGSALKQIKATYTKSNAPSSQDMELAKIFCPL